MYKYTLILTNRFIRGVKFLIWSSRDKLRLKGVLLVSSGRWCEDKFAVRRSRGGGRASPVLPWNSSTRATPPIKGPFSVPRNHSEWRIDGRSGDRERGEKEEQNWKREAERGREEKRWED